MNGEADGWNGWRLSYGGMKWNEISRKVWRFLLKKCGFCQTMKLVSRISSYQTELPVFKLNFQSSNWISSRQTELPVVKCNFQSSNWSSSHQIVLPVVELNFQSSNWTSNGQTELPVVKSYFQSSNWTSSHQTELPVIKSYFQTSNWTFSLQTEFKSLSEADNSWKSLWLKHESPLTPQARNKITSNSLPASIILSQHPKKAFDITSQTRK
jgi:hypothetical protein